MEEKKVSVQGTSSGKQNQRQSTLQKFRNLFSGYAASQKQPSRPLPTKRQKQEFFIPKETWTHEFFCLADCTTETVPSRVEKFELQSSGLGRRKIVSEVTQAYTAINIRICMGIIKCDLSRENVH